MGLLSLFQRHSRQDDAPQEQPPAEPDAVAAARTRARRRLIGAAVLLGIGVIGFPLLFETQPRPVPVDIPIEIPRKDGAPPLAPPAASPALSAASAAVVLPDADAPETVEPAARRPTEITERAADAGRDVTQRAASAPAPQAAVTPPKPAPAPAPTPAPAVAAAKPAASAPPRAATPAARQTTDAARAEALLNGQPAAAASAANARVVVQVGAYTEPDKLREARQKVEKMGFKTYTQVIEVDGAKRTRVRIGPFATRAEADKAAARIKASGLPAAILSL
jgi:DedD protein